MKGLRELLPREGRLYASPDSRVASIFMAGSRRALCLPIKGRVLAFFADSCEELVAHDKGGSLYLVPETPFRQFPGSNPQLELIATSNVTPIISFVYDSSIAAILAHGVHLHFVSDSTLEEFENADRRGALLTSAVLRSVLSKGSENRKLQGMLAEKSRKDCSSYERTKGCGNLDSG